MPGTVATKVAGRGRAVLSRNARGGQTAQVLGWRRDPIAGAAGMLPFLTSCMVQMLVMIRSADLYDLKPIIGCVRLSMRPVILLDDVVHVHALAKLDCRAAIRDQPALDHRVGAAFVDRDAGGNVTKVDFALQETPRGRHVAEIGQREVPRRAELVRPLATSQ